MALLLRAPLEQRKACDLKGVSKPALQLRSSWRSTGNVLLGRWRTHAYRELLTPQYASDPLWQGAPWRLKRRSRRSKAQRRGPDRAR